MPHPDSHNILSSKGRNCPATLCGATAFSSEGGADLKIEDSQDPGKGSSFFIRWVPKRTGPRGILGHSQTWTGMAARNRLESRPGQRPIELPNSVLAVMPSPC